MNRFTVILKRFKRWKFLKFKKQSIVSFPQRSAICLKVLTISPKKPNSANRRVSKIKLLKTKHTLTTKIPGEGHNLQQHSTILIRSGRSRDLIGVKSIAVRGKFDLNAVVSRTTSRSCYGVKKPKKI